MSEATTLVLVRHGESVSTVRRVIGGPRTCGGLSPLGRAQAEALAARLTAAPSVEERTVEVVYSSGYARARQTASIVAGALDLEVIVDEALGEHDPGPICDGLSFEEFVDRYGSPDWESEPHGMTFPGGETVAEFHHRVGAAVHAIVEAQQGRVVLIVCHGGVIDAILRSALHTAAVGGFELHTSNASLTELSRVAPGRWRLVRYNDAAHLSGLPRESPRSAGGGDADAPR